MNSKKSLIVPKNISVIQGGLYIKKYCCSFGSFNVLNLITYNVEIVEQFTIYSRDNGYSIKWKKNNDNSYEIIKIPMALLVQIVLVQNDKDVGRLVGAWAISSSTKCTAMNVITLIVNSKDGKRYIHKFSLYYPIKIDFDRCQTISILDGISFRTGILNGRNINEARYILYQLTQIKFIGMIIDCSEDAIYSKNNNKLNRIKNIDKFVKKMVNDVELRQQLQSSYINSGLSVLEDEWNLILELIS